MSEPTDGMRDGDPFWEALGAPETNTDKIAFKPPFPAYPSGHATFGAACFQIVRLFYKDRNNLSFGDHDCDEIGFSFVSDELDGYSRDLHQAYNAARPIADQPGTIRTRISRSFPSLWHAIFENSLSRIFSASTGVSMRSAPPMRLATRPGIMPSIRILGGSTMI